MVKEGNTSRLYFIDAIRAFAICMMMQGHFVDTLLAPEFRDDSNIIYSIWSYFRGITAPTFFTVAGLVFTFLLLRAKRKGSVDARLRKGISRGFLLIGIGYALRAPVFYWFMGEFPMSFLTIDVLHCIGMSLIITVLLYIISFQKPIVFGTLLFVIATLIFITEPWYRGAWNMVDGVKVYTGFYVSGPDLLVNWVSKQNKSVFTIIPWYGYMAYGAFIATIFDRYVNRSKFKISTVATFMITGIALAFYSTPALRWLHRVTDIQVILDAANFNYLFARLGNVFIIISLFYMFERYLKGSLIARIGQKTLSIYVIHFAILYGVLLGFGLYQFIGKTLTPWQAAGGAILFVISVTLIALYGSRTNAFFYSHLRKFAKKLKHRIQGAGN
jgi:uncharacterized membrane protein